MFYSVPFNLYFAYMYPEVYSCICDRAVLYSYLMKVQEIEKTIFPQYNFG